MFLNVVVVYQSTRNFSNPRGVFPEKLAGGVGPLPKTLSLFTIKICDIPYPIYDLTKNSKPYL